LLLASTAAALFVGGGARLALADHHETGEAKIDCQGVNECKGKGSCHSAQNSCAGKNECKGKGHLTMTPEECRAAKEALQKK
jgi:hypothetical protein